MSDNGATANRIMLWAVTLLLFAVYAYFIGGALGFWALDAGEPCILSHGGCDDYFPRMPR